MKFYAVVSYYLVNLNLKFHGDPCINMRARVVNTRMHVLSQVHACFIMSARVYDLCMRICARIIMKLKIQAHKIVIDHHMKFYENPSFGCGDFAKQNWHLFNP